MAPFECRRTMAGFSKNLLDYLSFSFGTSKNKSCTVTPQSYKKYVPRFDFLNAKGRVQDKKVVHNFE
jgi:hypothetical protein